MKKIIALTVIAASLAGSSAFAQGYFNFTSGKSQVYDGSGAAAVLASTIDVALLWAPAATTPAVDALATSSLKLGNNTTSQNTVGYSATQAWTAIMSGQFTPAVNAATSGSVVALTSATGAIAYNGSASFGITGTSAGTTYTLYEVSYLASFGTLAAAAAANSAVGWSAPIQYTAVSSIGTPQNTSGLFPSFGTFVPVPAPEPATLALAGLSGASLLLFRRRK